MTEKRMTEKRMTEKIITEKRMTEKRMTEKRMTEKRMTEKSLAYISHKEFHIIMNRPQFKSDLTGQDASDYDDFIDAKIQEYNDKILHEKP
jgi:hypothetical protein